MRAGARHINVRDERLRVPALVDDVAIDAVATLRQRRHLDVEREAGCRPRHRMQMRKRIEPGLANEKHVHQLAVIRQQRVVADGRDRTARPSRVVNLQRQDAAAGVIARQPAVHLPALSSADEPPRRNLPDRRDPGRGEPRRGGGGRRQAQAESAACSRSSRVLNHLLGYSASFRFDSKSLDSAAM